MEHHLFVVIVVLLIPAIFAAFASELLSSAVGLLVASVGVTLLFFDLGAPLAGVFELSVCAGLISVLFIMTISLTTQSGGEVKTERKKIHYRKFIALPILLVIVAIIGHDVLWVAREQWITSFPALAVQETKSVGEILWKTRGLDLLGQITIMLVGVYGVVILFKRGKMNE